MLITLKLNNCLIYDSEADFSMRANMHYKRFRNNVFQKKGTNILKTAVLIGPNNSGKTNFINAIDAIKDLMLGRENRLKNNLFSKNPVVEIAISFLEDGVENLLEIKYDVSKKEYVYEYFAQIDRDKYNNTKKTEYLIRDNKNKKFVSKDPELADIMKVAARNNLLIYLVDTEGFPYLNLIKNRIIAFASRIDIVDMNNIPIKKTIEMLKTSKPNQEKIKKLILSADLNLEDYKYLSDKEVKVSLEKIDDEEVTPQERALAIPEALEEMLHLTSIYKGVAVPSLFFDSTGTKKIAALAGYVIDAIENNRILVVDELDNSLHFRLTRAIIALFNNELNNGAQLIATVHDVSLLDCKTLFRKEQIWFTYKDFKGVYLYSLAEFTSENSGVRETSDLVAKYREGLFGALPEPDLFEALLEVKNYG